MIRLLLVYYGLWVSIMRGVMGYSSARWRVRIISGYLRGLGLLFREISNSIFWLQDSVDIRLSSFLCRQSSVVLSSIVNHVLSVHRIVWSSFLQLIFISSVNPPQPCVRWWLVDGCCLLAPHLSGVAVWRRNFAAVVCDSCQHPTSCSVNWHGASRDDLVSSVTCPCHRRRWVWLLSRFHFVDQFPVVTVLLVRPVLLAEWAREVELLYSVWGTVSLVLYLTSVTGWSPLYRIIVRYCFEMSWCIVNDFISVLPVFLRFCLLKCMLIFFLIFYKMFVQRSEFNSG